MKRNVDVRKTTIVKRDDYIHIETTGCIINIYPGLQNTEGEITTVEVLPDGDRFSDGHTWKIVNGGTYTHVARIEKGCK